MKIFRCLCLSAALAVIILSKALAQDTTKNSLLSSNLPNQAAIQNLIQQNAAKLQMMGISPSDAQNLANQYLPQLQGGLSSGTSTIQANVPANPQNVTVIQSLPANSINNPLNSPQGNKDEPSLPKPTIFGQQIFRDKQLQLFNKSTDMQAPDNYILGVGDKVTINVWGYSSFSNSYTIDESGAILPTQTGKIFLKGLTYADAKKLIKSRFSSVFDITNSELDVTIVYSRNIVVNIVGEVFDPGSYNMPAINTVFNALIAASGPTNIGSLRKIYVKRGGQTVKTLDVYQFLLDPDSKQDFYLQDNDYIFIPPIGKVVNISGEVLRSNSFELLDGENLNSLLHYAGGLTPKAFLNKVTIQRYEGIQTKLININLDSLLKTKSDFQLMNGDVITINPIPETVINQVKIIGPVTSPGVFSFTQGQRISDLINGNPLRPDALLDRGYIIRTNDDLSKQYLPFSPAAILQSKSSNDNLLLKSDDIITFFSKSIFKDDLTFSINGEVRNPGQYTFGSGMNLKDALYLSGGLKPTAADNRIEISRVMEVQSGETINAIPVIVKSISIQKDLNIDDASAGFILQPNDVITVRTSSDYDRQNVVTVIGDVLYPGNYVMLNKLETWTALLNRAGGLTNSAYIQDAYILRKQNGEGISLSHLDRAMKKPGGKYDYILKAGDEIVVPRMNNSVAITGLIRYPNIDSLKQINVPYSKCRGAKFYIKKYGLGFDKLAKRSRTYVINPGMNVKGCHKFIVFNCYPKVKNGSTIVVTGVPPREMRNNKEHEPVDWNKAITTFTVSLTGIATLYVLLTRIQ